MLSALLAANLEAARGRRQQLANENLARANAKRTEYNYSAGGKVMMVEYDPTKLEVHTRGPYRLARIFTSGAARAQRRPHVQEAASIRKLLPCRGA